MKELGLNDQTLLVRNDEQYLTSLLGDELVLLDLSNGNYISMNEVGTVIWKMLEQPTSFGKLIEQLVAGSGIDRATCLKETTKFLGDIFHHKMILYK